MFVAQARPRLNITTGLNDIDSAAKAIIYHAFLIFIDDIRALIKKHVDGATKQLLEHADQTIRSHAQDRRKALKKWLSVDNPLAWDNEDRSSGNYSLLSIILCHDPNMDNPALALSNQAPTYEVLAQRLTDYASTKEKRNIAPLTKNGGFQHVLPIARDMVLKIVPAENNRLSYWTQHLVQMMKQMKIHLIPWRKDTPNAYATDPAIWTSLRRTKGLPSTRIQTLEDRIQDAAETISRKDPHAPWDLPDTLSDMKLLWNKEVLPTCWSIQHASLNTHNANASYVISTYHYVSENYDGGNWAHHLALIIAICFSRVVPDICFASDAVISSDNPLVATEEVRQMAWVPTQSTSHKGTVAPLPFIVMMSTALIGFWDSKSPLSKHLASHQNVLGKHWTDK